MPNKQEIQSVIKDDRFEAVGTRNVPKEVGQHHLSQLFRLIEDHFNSILPSQMQGHASVLMHKAMMPSQKYAQDHMAEVFFTMHETNQFITALYERWHLAKETNREIRKEVCNG